VQEAASGHGLALVLSDEEVSPAKAGELLGLSRQYVDRLIAEGVLAARRLPGSTHRRLRVADALAFSEQRDRRRKRIADMVDTLVDVGAEY
jgi:excisionase family DNA binding protein